jgi:hypothetical protein
MVVLALFTFGQKICLLGFALIFGTWATDVLIPGTTSLPLTLLFFVGMFCVTYGLCENAEIPN